VGKVCQAAMVKELKHMEAKSHELSHAISAPACLLLPCCCIAPRLFYSTVIRTEGRGRRVMQC